MHSQFKEVDGAIAAYKVATTQWAMSSTRISTAFDAVFSQSTEHPFAKANVANTQGHDKLPNLAETMSGLLDQAALAKLAKLLEHCEKLESRVATRNKSLQDMCTHNAKLEKATAAKDKKLVSQPPETLSHVCSLLRAFV